MKRVLIVNMCGQLSALPTVDEYNQKEFSIVNKIVGLVEVSERAAAMIHQESARVRVLMPGLPKPERRGTWLYVAVLNGQLVLVSAPKPNINTQKSEFPNKRFRASFLGFFARIKQAWK